MRCIARCFVTLVAFILLLPAFAVAAAALEGKVVAVADGDTLTVLDGVRQQHRIRLAAIDAPEGGQAFGNRAKQALSTLCFGKIARIEVTDTDRYGRTVGTVHCDGLNANAELVRQGMAWVYVQYAAKDSPLFALEREAREARRGLWSEAAPIAPWEWRRTGGTGNVSDSPRSGVTGEIRGNRRSNIYHLPHCPNYGDVSSGNRVSFASESEARAAGFRKARNC